MAVQLFRLRNVPDDEAEDIRNLLTKHHFDYYETPAGNWGISMPAIWLHDDHQFARAKAIIDEYQQQRSKNAKLERVREIQEGNRRGLISSFLKSPIQMIVYTVLAVVILYFSIKPFLNFGQ